MAERRVAKSDDFKSVIRTNSNTILNDLGTNPGSTAAEIATSTSLNQLIVDQILSFGVKAQIIVARSDFSGVVRYWMANDWADLILARISDARTWVDSLGANGALEGGLRDDLITAGVSSNEAEAVTTALTNALINEGAAETS